MNIKPLRQIVLVGGVALLVTACGGVTKSPALLEAEEAYGQAKSDPKVLQYASSELDRAQQALNRAAMAESEADMNTLAYVGGTRTQTAIAVAERKAAMARMDELSKLKDQEQLVAREMEIEREKRLREEQLGQKEMELREREQALARAEAEREALKQELAALEAKKTERGMVMTLGDVLFETGKAALLPGAMSTIDRLAHFLKEYPEKTVLVEGHTDDVGSAEFNQRLSEQRAASVRAALLDRGIEGHRIETLGMGESTPIADNGSESGRMKNRRVEIVIRD